MTGQHVVASDAVSAVPAGGVIGGLGWVGDGLVEGWALDPRNTSVRHRVVILLDGDIVAFGRADRSRPQGEIFDLAGTSVEVDADDEDVRACGFSCEVPKTRLHSARLLTVMVETGAGYVLLAERGLGGGIAQRAPRGPALHFDITDLLEFLVHHREVSGIQRVQCGYLANALAAPGEAFAIRVCAQPRGAHRYVEISHDTIVSILAGIEGKRSMPDASWRRYIEQARLGSGMEPDFRPGDIVLTTGAPWVYEEYYRAIRQAKREHGVFYFQISYDLIPVVQPETAAIGIIGGFTRSLAGMLESADHILAISEHTRGDLLQTCAKLGTRCPPVSVIPMGATLNYLDEAWVPPAPDGRASPRALYGDYVLCVGTIEPRKNHLYLYLIWQRLLQQREAGLVPRLVCVGRMGWHMEEFERRLKASNYLDGYFVHLTEIGDDMLARLYQDCLFTVFPSIYEGWGLPVAESLLFGRLCVASNSSSIPEVGGEWAVYLDPHSIDDGQRVIAGLLDDRERLAGLERRLVAGYRPVTWRAASDALLRAVAVAHEALTPFHADHGLARVAIGHHYRFTNAGVAGGPLRQLAHAVDVCTIERLLAGPDWHRLESWGCWSCGGVARFGFRLPEECAETLSCFLVLRLPGEAGVRCCSVSIGGRDGGTFDLPGGVDTVVRIGLPGEAGRAIRIEIRMDEALLPAGGSGDQRVLGIGARGLAVMADSDAAGLVGYFEDQMISVDFQPG